MYAFDAGKRRASWLRALLGCLLLCTAVLAAPVARAHGGDDGVVNGSSVVWVGYGTGEFAQVAPGRWHEGNGEGNHEFEETGRDEWSVYLLDRSRDMRIQLDLFRKEVIVGDGDARRPIYAIVDARAADVVAEPTQPTPVVVPAALGAKGADATEVDYGAGAFAMAGAGRWRERNGDGSHEFEETGRDEWSVYLLDRSRDVRIQLDLFRREVILDEHGARRVLYAIRGAHAGGIPQPVAVVQPVQPVQPTLPPLVAASKVLTGPYIDPSITGYNASSVTYNKDGRTLGLVVTQGGGHWREIATQGGMQNAFEETGRDATSVYLFDASRNVRLQLDLANKQVLYGEGDVVSMRPLYDIHSARADPLAQDGFAAGQSRPVVDPVQPVVDPGQPTGGVGETLPSARGPSTANKEFCWKDSIPRGVGTIPQGCGPGREMLGALCYSQCGPNSARFGLDCHSVCPDGMRDDGLFCRASEYGRGTGYAVHVMEFDGDGMKARCEADHGRGQCEFWGAMAYPKCKAGYEAVGCCICRPVVPDCDGLGLGGRLDLSCAKKVVIGDPSVGTCAAGEEEDAGLCYRQCEPGYSGVGPVCWAGAPKDWVECGMGAAKDSSTCATIVVGQVQTVGQLAFNIATLGEGSAATKAASTAGKAAEIGELQRRYQQLKRLYEQAQPAIDAALQAHAAAGTAVDTVELMDEEVVTEADILRISAQIAAIADPTGVADTVAAYSYPKCSAYGFQP
jgi:hypothetical protein